MKEEMVGTSERNLAQEVIKRIEVLLGNANDLSLKDIKGFGEDVSTVFRIAQGAVQLISQKKFEKFLEGISQENVPTSVQIEKLMSYIDNETKAEFISNTFTKVLMSNSTLACAIIGSVIKKLINEQQQLSHEYLICIRALGDLFDKDIENILLFEAILARNPKFKSFYYFTVKKYSDENNHDYLSAVLTLEKCVSLQVLNRNFESHIDASIDGENDSFDLHSSSIDEYFAFTKSGLLLIDHIKRVKSANKII